MESGPLNNTNYVGRLNDYDLFDEGRAGLNEPSSEAYKSTRTLEIISAILCQTPRSPRKSDSTISDWLKSSTLGKKNDYRVTFIFLIDDTY